MGRDRNGEGAVGPAMSRRAWRGLADHRRSGRPAEVDEIDVVVATLSNGASLRRSWG